MKKWKQLFQHHLLGFLVHHHLVAEVIEVSVEIVGRSFGKYMDNFCRRVVVGMVVVMAEIVVDEFDSKKEVPHDDSDNDLFYNVWRMMNEFLFCFVFDILKLEGQLYQGKVDVVHLWLW